MKNFLNNYSPILSVIGLVLYVLPFIILGQDSYVTIHDNLDSDVVWFKTVAESENYFSFSNEAEVKKFMNGIPRNSLPPTLNFISFLFVVFEPYVAYLINFILTHLFGFVSMYLLLKDFIFKESSERFFLFGVSLCFALLPFYGTHPGLAISGIPFVAWIFTHIYHNSYRWYHFLILFLYCFYSSLIYTGIFILFFLVCISFYIFFYKKRVFLPFLLGIILMICGYILAEINTINLVLFGNDFTSHRAEFNPLKRGGGKSLLQSLYSSVDLFFNGYYHAPTLNTPFVITSVLVALLIASFKKTYKEKNELRLLVIIMTSIISICLFYGLWNFNGFLVLRENFAFLNKINLSRIYWLNPFLWFISFSLAIKIINDSKLNITYHLICVLISGQILMSFWANRNLVTNYASLLIGFQSTATPTYKEFYSSKLFEDIDKYIGKPKETYRVASVGLYPDIAVYNGFYSLASYQRNYPITYKREFRKIIRPELQKSPKLQKYYDYWGSRCYIFTKELGRTYLINEKKEIEVDLNMKKFKSMGGRYIFSSVLLKNAEENNMKFERKFSNESSFYDIYLYSLDY